MNCNGKNKECSYFNSGMYALEDECTNCYENKCVNDYYLLEAIIKDLSDLEFGNVDIQGFGVCTVVEKHKIENIIKKYI